MSDDAGNIHIDLTAVVPLNITVDAASPLEYIEGEVVTQLILSTEPATLAMPPLVVNVLELTIPLQQAPGLSAYQVAQLEHPGVWPTAQDWLDSLQGPPGDSVATDPGDLSEYFVSGLNF